MTMLGEPALTFNTVLISCYRVNEANALSHDVKGHLALQILLLLYLKEIKKQNSEKEMSFYNEFFSTKNGN